jgi:hypothetical protein
VSADEDAPPPVPAPWFTLGVTLHADLGTVLAVILTPPTIALILGYLL